MTVLDSVNEVVMASTTHRPNNPTFEYENKNDERLYATVFFSPHLLATPSGIAELEVAGVETFKPNSAGSLATRSQLPLATAVPIDYEQKIKFRLWADVDNPELVDGSLFIVLSDTPDPVEPPKNVDLTVQTRLGRAVTIFPFRAYTNEIVTQPINMRGHQKMILTLSPTALFVDKTKAPARLEINVDVQPPAAASSSGFSGTYDYIVTFANGGTLSANRSLDEYGNGEDISPVTTNEETIFDLKDDSEKTLNFASTPFDKTFKASSGFKTNIRGVKETLLTISAQPVSYTVQGTDDIIAGAWTTIVDNADNFPAELVTSWQYLRVDFKYKLKIVITSSSRTFGSASNTPPPYDAADYSINEDIDPFETLEDFDIFIPSHIGGIAELSMQLKTESGAWIDYISAETISNLIQDSGGKAILSPDTLDGTILPTVADSLRFRMAVTDGIQTGVQVILS